MTIEQSIELLKAEYEKAKRLDYIRNPLAYALYQVWRVADRKGSDKKMTETEMYRNLPTNEQLNLYRNKYFTDNNTTENGIIANAINDMLIEFDRLYDTCDTDYKLIRRLNKCYENAKSEAYKEFAERLKKDLFYKCGDINYSETCDLRKFIDSLLKELGGEEE